MGKKWDTINNYYQWCLDRAKELYRVLIPGAYCLVFGGTRTHHRLVCAFEDAGFEIKDEIQWIYGQGFPKSYNVSKGFQKQGKNGLMEQWDGWGTCLKPAQEPIMVAQKPIDKNYCYNIETYGVGGLNIDDSRISFKGKESPKDLARSSQGFTSKNEIYHNNDKYKISSNEGNSKGRFPANVIFDEDSAKVLDAQSGELKSGLNCIRSKEGYFVEQGGLGKAGDIQITYGDSGGASRFFYCAKATQKDKTENSLVDNGHPTVKPTDLIKYLVRLVTPKNGICIDICEGSGTHAKACIELTKEDYPVNYIGFENELDSYNIALNRIAVNQ